MAEFTYTVRRVDDKHFEISKWGDRPEPLEQYDIVIPNIQSDEGIFCNCQGFRRQKYPLHEHKHIRLVRLFLRQQEPSGRVYEIDGKFPDFKFTIVNASLYSEPLEFDPSD